MNTGTNTLPEMHHSLPPRGSRALSVLQDGGLVLLPTANLWQLACLHDEPQAIKKLLATCSRELRPELVFPDLETLRIWCPRIHPKLDTLLYYHGRAVTLLVPAGRSVPLALIDQEGLVAVRLAMDSFTYRLCEDLEAPLVACVAVGEGDIALPTRFGKIRSDVLRAATYTVQRRQREELAAETTLVVRVRGDEIEFL